MKFVMIKNGKKTDNGKIFIRSKYKIFSLFLIHSEIVEIPFELVG